MPYFPTCGAENEADATFCESCGARLSGEAPPESLPTSPGRGLRWPLIAAALLLAALGGGGAAALFLLGGNGDSEDSTSRAVETSAATATPTAKPAQTPESTARPEPTARQEPTSVPEPTVAATPTPRQDPPTVPPPLGYATPEEAIAGRVVPSDYAGDCSTTTVEEDVGKICSSLYEGEGTRLVYLVGLTFSEFGEWLLLEQQADGTWLIADSRPVETEMESPWP